MLDGEYAFESAVQISDYLQRDGEVAPHLVVGLSYGVGFGPPLAIERTRDYTPPVDQARVVRKAETPFYRFIRDRLLPRLQDAYRIDPANRVIWGYSLSGSFVTWLEFFDPSLFSHSIVASGNSIQFGLVEKIFQGQIFSAAGYTGRRVFISVDTTEVGDPKTLEQAHAILARPETFPGRDMRLFVTQGESHASSWFVSLPTSLRFIFRPERARAVK